MASHPDTPEALGVIELRSIVRGYRVLDAMVKRAPVGVRQAYPVSSGKFLVFVDGMVAEVDEAMSAGLDAAGAHAMGRLFLPNAHPGLWAGLDDSYPELRIDALGLLESESVVDALLGTDVALKAADVELVALHLAQGIGGRAYFVVAGSQPNVEAAIEASEARVRPELVIEREIITAPHDDMTRHLLGRETVHPKY